MTTPKFVSVVTLENPLKLVEQNAPHVRVEEFSHLLEEECVTRALLGSTTMALLKFVSCAQLVKAASRPVHHVSVARLEKSSPSLAELRAKIVQPGSTMVVIVKFVPSALSASKILTQEGIWAVSMIKRDQDLVLLVLWVVNMPIKRDPPAVKSVRLVSCHRVSK